MLLILGGMWWFRPRLQPTAPQTLTLEGRLPDDPKAEIRAYFPDLNYTATCQASQLGLPGQPFKWTVQVPGQPGKVEMQTVRPQQEPAREAPVAISGQTVQASPPPAAGAGGPSAASPAGRKRGQGRSTRQRKRRERESQRHNLRLLKHRHHK